MGNLLKNFLKRLLDTGPRFVLRGLSVSVFCLFLLFPLSLFFLLPEKGLNISDKSFQTEAVQEKKRIREIIHDFNTGLKYEERYKLAETIFYESLKYGHDPLLIVAVIKVESSFNNRAISSKGARGLMQILPLTASEIAEEANFSLEGNKTLHNPFLNIKMGTYYLFKMNLIFKDTDIALEAYNIGPTKISRMLKNGKRLRKRYSRKVLSFYNRLKKQEI